jgi:MFS family permease
LATALGGIAEAFGDANFRRYSVGAIVSWLSFFVQTVAVAWVAWTLTHSTRWLAAIALLDAVPMSVLAPLGGVIADRYDRFRILQASYALATLQAASLAAIAFAGRLTIEWLAALTFLHGTIHAFSVPAQFGLLPRFVERRRLPSAIAVASAYAQLGYFVGPALAGWVILRFGPAAAFASNVLGYGVYFCSSALLRTPGDYQRPRASRGAFVSDLFDGLRVIASHRGIVGLLTLMLFGNALAAAIRQMMPAFADVELHAGVAGLSSLLAGAGVGATLAALWLAQGGARRSTTPVIIWGFLAFLIAAAGLMASRGLAPAVLAMVGFGCCLEICRTGTLALLQTTVADGIRGRLMSTQFLLQQGASSVGVLVVGAVAQDWGLRTPILCGIGLAMLGWLVTVRARARIAASFAVAADP